MLTPTQESFLPCPTCGEIIGSNAPHCKYCNASVDPQAAAVAADLQQEVNQACNDARMARRVAGIMWIAFAMPFLFAAMGGLAFIGTMVGGMPLLWIVTALLFVLSWMGVLAFIGMMVAVPPMLIRWQSRFGHIKTNDVDFKTARHNRNIALLLWLPTPVVIAVALFIFGSRS
jgi:hypothetical protein